MNAKNVRRIFLISFFITALFSLSGCTTLSEALKKEFYTTPEVLPVEALCPETIEWQKIQDGFEMTGFQISSIGVSWHCVKIDLDTKDLQILITPEKKDAGLTFELKEIARKNNAVVTFNTAPFDEKRKTYLPSGIIKIDGKIHWEADRRYCALAFYRNEHNSLRAAIVDKQTDTDFSEYCHASGGFFTIYKDGKIIPFAKNKRSRTGCGISSDGRFLYVMVTTPNFHLTDRNGLNYEECALIFEKLGCTEAMQFDGGHSSGLVVKGKNIEAPFMQRKVPCLISFYVQTQGN